jgi:hypothetical protein
MALPRGYSKDGKKNSAGFNDSLKQRETRTARIVSYGRFFLVPAGQETHNLRKNH